MTKPQVQESERVRCRHLWQPYADAERIWRVCDKCGTEEHVTTHHDALMHNLAYIFKDVPR